MVPALSQNCIPRWRGFNLMEALNSTDSGDYRTEDFQLIADLGFNFVRLPMCYLLWTPTGDPFAIDDSFFTRIDRILDTTQRCGLHLCLNFHRAPGYSVNQERNEPFNLWKDPRALEAFCFHWQYLARRYRSVDSVALSFNLVNEPAHPSWRTMTRRDHERVIRAATAAIRGVDPDRLILADGIAYGGEPCLELADLGIAQSCRAYAPGGVTHYRVPWVQTSQFPPPRWPGGVNWDLRPWDRTALEAYYRPWASLLAKGIGVHCGEGGAYCHTPHEIVLAWWRDVLEILTPLGIGYALWNFRGPFGILDSQRADVAYESWHGHQLDRLLLQLLQEF